MASCRLDTNPLAIEADIAAVVKQLAEIKHYREIRKSKQHAANSLDKDVAWMVFEQEIKAIRTRLTGLKIAYSTASAINQDSPLITLLQAEEAQASSNRILAHQASRASSVNVQKDLEICTRVSSNQVEPQRQHQNDAFYLSTAPFSTQRRDELECVARCTACYETFSLRKLEFCEAEVEFTTTDRIYCSNLDCGRFIPPAQITFNLAHCLACDKMTCSTCKSVFHQGEDCPEDMALAATLDLARSEGWQRCFSCRAVVQLGVGCHHITCTCQAQFCYLCGSRWKTCKCERWDEHRLLKRAEEVVERDALGPMPRQEQQQRVRDMQEDLRQNHEYEHSRRFERIEGGGRRGFTCEMCEARYWKFILECRRCHLREPGAGCVVAVSDEHRCLCKSGIPAGESVYPSSLFL
ncbi:hypothetical protein BO86DRAFT_419760 [Aspergillus japonicus CBS 114.51]|uniref:IBR domain-containing protein n=1 Tax=Aspergillus japonicus CBS 114.51 TaxID=1448312 RepID=A0A8T8WYW7_ASPJA|nr:hypothetical protein BO86DRAFT_419760 [Aspergillus japonicus CBS 114.51]RAH80840.1 hypothetical protein BO86DRAFT_419760 [Aspergillus japonicus CBS 114.51]